MVLAKIISALIASHFFAAPVNIKSIDLLAEFSGSVASERAYTLDYERDSLDLSVFHITSSDDSLQKSLGLSFDAGRYGFSGRYLPRKKFDLSLSYQRSLFDYDLEFEVNHGFGKNNLSLASCSLFSDKGSFMLEAEFMNGKPNGVYGSFVVRF